MSSWSKALFALFGIVAVMLPDTAGALEGRSRQVLIESMFLEVGLGGSRSSGSLGIDWNNNQVFDNVNESYTRTRGFLALGVETPGPQIDGLQLVFGTNAQIFFDSEVFDVDFDIGQNFNSRIHMKERNAFNITPYVGVNIPLATEGNGNATRSNLLLFVGPTIADQKLTVDVDNGDSIQHLTNSSLSVSPTIGAELLVTNLAIAEGNTIALGGLEIGLKGAVQATFAQKTRTLDGIPIVGALFRSNRDVDVSAELLIVLTPRIVNPVE